MDLFYSSNNSLSCNNLSSNAMFGMRILEAGSKLNTIWNNTFYHNNGSGDSYDPLHLQAFDAGTNNRWNGSDGYGNWWSDWTAPDAVSPWGIVDNPFNISGSAGARDFRPLTTPGVIWIPEFSDMLLPIIASMLIGLAFGSMRRKAG